jgi:uncharacterized membrane protein YhhN
MASIQSIWLPLLVAVFDWFTVLFRWRLLGYLTKPGVMVALLVWLWSTTGLHGPLLLIGIALLFSLTGDIFLMFPRKLFSLAIISFSMAHLVYIITMNLTKPPLNHFVILLFSLIIFISILFSKHISHNLIVRQLNNIIPFIWVYSFLISVMLFSALLTLWRPDWERTPALFLSTGALLFFFSDSLLAIHNFVSPISYGQLIIRISYHLGQIAIVFGFSYQFQI